MCTCLCSYDTPVFSICQENDSIFYQAKIHFIIAMKTTSSFNFTTISVVRHSIYLGTHITFVYHHRTFAEGIGNNDAKLYIGSSQLSDEEVVRVIIRF